MGKVYTTKTKANASAAKRRKGFRKLKKGASPQRKRYLDESIKTVKVKKIQRKHWKKPLYEVKGR